MPPIEEQRKVEAAFLAMAENMSPDDLLELDESVRPVKVSDVLRIVKNAIWRRGGMKELRTVQLQASKSNSG